MKQKNIFMQVILFACIVQAHAQSGMDSVLSNVERNNKTLLAEKQYLETQKLQFKTGITPYNPTVEYDYLYGKPVNTAGNQTDFTIAQSFDFPTAYIRKKQLANEQITHAELQYTAARQNILLEAKKVCISLVYHHKLQAQLFRRKQHAEQMLGNLQSRLNKGEGNILDVSKAQLQLIEIKKEVQENISAISQFNEMLNALNGGNKIVFSDTLYSFSSIILPFEQLEKEFEQNDPWRKMLEQEKIVTQKHLEVNKSLWLPKMELGYHYQGILGQTYNGIHTGISIPLWENKNTVKLQQTKLLFNDLALEDHRNDHYYEIKALYEKYANLKITMTEYQTVLGSFSNFDILDRSLAAGQISTLEYLMEVKYYQNAYTSYLQTEKEYFEVISELLKYQL